MHQFSITRTTGGARADVSQSLHSAVACLCRIGLAEGGRCGTHWLYLQLTENGTDWCKTEWIKLQLTEVYQQTTVAAYVTC